MSRHKAPLTSQNTGVILGLYRDNGKVNGNYYNRVVYWGYIRIMEKKMETTISLFLTILGSPRVPRNLGNPHVAEKALAPVTPSPRPRRSPVTTSLSSGMASISYISCRRQGVSGMRRGEWVCSIYRASHRQLGKYSKKFQGCLSKFRCL